MRPKSHCGRSSVRTDEWDEHHWHQLTDLEAATPLHRLHEHLLGSGITPRHHKPAVFAKLVYERLWYIHRHGGDDYGVVRGVRRPSCASVTVFDLHSAVAKTLESLSRRVGEIGPDLDTEDLRCAFDENRCLITRPCANLENPLVAPKAQGLGHDGNDVGLRDGLIKAYRQRPILVGPGAPSLGDEPVARNACHCGQDARILHTPQPNLGIHHAAAGSGFLRPILTRRSRANVGSRKRCAGNREDW